MLVSVAKMATVIEGCTTEEQRSFVCFLGGGGAKGLNAKDVHKEIFPAYGGKCLSCKVVRNWIDTFSQGRSKVADDARPGRSVEIATEATVQWVEELIRADRRIMIGGQCSNCTRVQWGGPTRQSDSIRL
jgi:hypothetical protein